MTVRTPPTMTKDRLERAAYHYLERFATSRENLRRVLERKVRRSNDGFGEPTAEQATWIAAVIDRCETLGLLDDESYAAMKARALAARGKGRFAIRRWLRARGVTEDIAERALDAIAEEAGGPRAADCAAALRFARRRRLGPFRSGAADRVRRNKEIAAFARAGFDYGLARAVVEARSEAALDAIEQDDAQREEDWP